MIREQTQRTAGTGPNRAEEIYEKCLKRDPLTAEEAYWLYEQAPLQELALTADRVRRAVVPDLEVVTWQIDRNVNITNVCISGCHFCNFHCKPHQTERAFITTLDEYKEKIERMLALGGDQLLLQGGLHPKLGIDFYEELFSTLKSLYPQVRLHALGAPEGWRIARISGLTTLDTLKRLIAAGLDSLPGAGAEILDPGVRKAISPAKPSVEEWIQVMHEAHCLNLPTSATMMYGHVETSRQRVDHLLRIRDLQARCPEGHYGFLAFIPWIFSLVGHRIGAAGSCNPLFTIGIHSHNRRQPTGSEQHPQHPGFVAHRRQGHRSGSAAQRRQRHGFDHDRGERRFFGRGAQPVRCRRHPTSDPRGGLHASSAGPALPNAVTIPMRQAISTEEGYFPARKKAGKFRLFYSERILNSTRRL